MQVPLIRKVEKNDCMIDHHISHTIPFDKITKCAQVKAINISRVRSSPCFPNVHLVIKVELELPPAPGHCR